ncbi:MAG: dihydroneopterin aldolase [Deltaproteobacteria bacterium]|nr:dihydroneopterin aldolase [Deltaproteobacteria bacterium]
MIHRNPVKITIENLRVRAIIGINDWERHTRQDVVVNVELELLPGTAFTRDAIDETVDYKRLNKRIIEEVEASSFFLIERLCEHVLGLVMDDPRVGRARVRVAKPGALRYTDSVSVECSAERTGAESA